MCLSRCLCMYAQSLEETYIDKSCSSVLFDSTAAIRTLHKNELRLFLEGIVYGDRCDRMIFIQTSVTALVVS